MDVLEHHGVKGQKWGVRRYQNYDGTRIGKSDAVLKKGSSVYRYSNKKESGSLEGAYTFVRDNDAREYLKDAKNLQIGFKDYSEIRMAKISVLDDATIRRGADTVKDIVDKIGDTNVQKSYEVLANAGYLDDSKTTYERYKIWTGNVDALHARATVGSAMNKYLFNKASSKETRKAQLDEYKKLGYDAIVDPEDFIWNYEMPMILLNDSKFKRVADGAVWNKSRKETMAEKEKSVNDGKGYKWFTDKDWEAINKVKNMGGKSK